MKLRLSENFRAVFYAPFYATHALGLDAQEGLEIELVGSSVPGDAVPRLLDGSIDVTWGGPMRVMMAHEKDPASPLTCFGEVVARDPFYLVGRPDIDGFSFADLTRLRFATVSEVPTPWMCLQQDLRLAGIDPVALKRVTDQTMAENLAALREGRLDVVQLFEPFVTRALRGGFGKILYAASARGPCVYTSYIASRQRIAREPAAFAALVRATGRMQQWLAAKGAGELAAVTAEFYPDVTRDELAEALGRYAAAGIWPATPAMSRAGFCRLGESFKSGGALSAVPAFETCVPSDLPVRGLLDLDRADPQ
jgi:NitT/TauT family transport system substrate-binding protein